MNDPTNDEMLADAIACMSIDLLSRLNPDTRANFCRDLLALAATYESFAWPPLQLVDLPAVQ